jgi:hypothetical protein
MARTDTIQNGHGPHRPDHWSALPWRPYASRAPLDTTADASVFHASMLRRELRRWLDADVTEHLAGDAILTAYEAIAEIVALADPLDTGLIRMQAHLDDDQGARRDLLYRQLGAFPRPRQVSASSYPDPRAD